MCFPAYMREVVLKNYICAEISENAATAGLAGECRQIANHEKTRAEAEHES